MLSPLPGWSKSWNYSSLTRDEPLIEKSREEEEEEEILRPHQTNWRKSNVFLWMSNLLFISLSFYLYLTLRQQRIHAPPSLGSWENGFTTEFAPVRSQIAMEHRKFWGAPRWTKEGVGSLLTDPNEPVFVGEATDQLDDNWDDFIGDRYFEITEDEARAAWGPGYHEYYEHNEGGYVAGLDVMHLLHCVNFIRQAFSPDRYQSSPHAHKHAKIDPTLHRDHCLEAIRQSLKCSADLTPIPSRYYEALGQNYIDSNRPHVCRNWGNIRSWVNERVNGSLEVKVPKPSVVKHLGSVPTSN